ncbi:hypothetical protein [Marinobacterium arenosum]|uniref:hypothetical protein n=1 Tax=Marinobacterium arenosum TaxID=2862496 RepID=UPI001C9539FA|nr:hypothetical protein [Marinobacterium arenosum]MBY4677303.1 hypothetical protein [Marinobacterium arenosum]
MTEITEKTTEAWLAQANRLFAMPKPAHFTNYRHCCECAEHDATLCGSSVERIGLAELGSPAWDPLCFATVDGLKYYLPAMVRLSLTTLDDAFYLAQMLFHLIRDGEGNDLVCACSAEQRRFICDLLAYLLDNHTAQIDAALCGDQLLMAHDIWSLQ